MIKKRKSMREQVYEFLKKKIVRGEIEEGSRIVEEEYSEKLKISRTPLREALRMLELEGLVETREKGGVVVPIITKNDVEEILKIRIALETLILEEVVEKFTREDFEKLDENLKKTESIIEDDDKASEVFSYFSEFNKLIYEVSGLPRIVTLINNLNLYLKRFRKLSSLDSSRRKRAHFEHKKIIECMKNGNKKEAIEINRAHLMESKEFLINLMKHRDNK